MTDPAVEAAYRYREDRYPEDDGLIGVAREALKPIRELHQYEFIRMINDSLERCRGCGDYWPCATAKLIYTSEELER